MVWTELHVTAGRAQWKSLFSSFLETASPARLLCIGFFHSSRKQKTIQLRLLFVFFWSWPTCALVHWGIAVFQGVSQEADAEGYCKDAQVQSFLSPSKQALIVLSLHLCPAEAAVTCPDREPELEVWNPGHNEENRVEIRKGRKLLLSSSATVHSIHITDGGKTCCCQGCLHSALHWDCLNPWGLCWESFLLRRGWRLGKPSFTSVQGWVAAEVLRFFSHCDQDNFCPVWRIYTSSSV